MEKGFTLVIPLYNKINVFRNTLDSVLNNHGSYPFKCIIVDDDSTDGSSEIGEEYDTRYPDIFTYVKKKHRGFPGPSFARNLGIQLTDTEYIGFLDCDDELCAGFVDRGCTFLDEHPEYSLYGNGHIDHDKDQNGNDLFIDVKYRLTEIHDTLDYLRALANNGRQVHFCANIYKTEIAKQIKFNDVYGEDIDFELRYHYKYPNIYIDNSICSSIIHNANYSDSNKWYFTRTYSNCLYEIVTNLKNEIPELEYDFWVDEKDEVMYQKLK